MSDSKVALVGWGILPIVLLTVVAVAVTNTGLLDLLRPAPPVEEIAFERVSLAPGEITIQVANGGPDPVTIAQVTVDNAFWNFSIVPAATIPRLGRATITIPYPWVEEEAYEIALLSSTGVTFSHEIPVAMVTPPIGPGFFGIFFLIGVLVGVIPVALGLLWLPFLRRLEQKWIHFALALTAGLLVFLGVDAAEETLEAASQVGGAYQGTLVALMGVVGTMLFLKVLTRRRLHKEGAEGRMGVAFLVAIGIGFHNLGEGLLIGVVYALGDASLGAFLIVGFMLHNTTEGLAIVSPIAKDNPTLRALMTLGLVAGVPTIAGAWLGGMAYSPLWATLFLSIGVGAIIQVVAALYKMVARQSPETVWTPLTAGGLMAGLVVMYTTGLFVAL
ncbi:MAG: metal transporter [Gemmatimonadetes bacterium]|nr:metal transporter [Gemmatimonadota bacterium]